MDNQSVVNCFFTFSAAAEAGECLNLSLICQDSITCRADVPYLGVASVGQTIIHATGSFFVFDFNELTGSSRVIGAE